MKLVDVMALAWLSIKNNKLRTAITVAIITFGLTALIGILTSIEAMKIKLQDSFAFMGANSYTIRAKERKINIGGKQITYEKKEVKQKLAAIPPISYNEAISFKQNFDFPATVSVSTNAQFVVTVAYNKLITNPNVTFIAADENYISVNGFSILHGRNMLATECDAASNVCLIGYDIATKFFKSAKANAIGQLIKVNQQPFLIVGVLQPKGAAAFLSFDNTVITNNLAGQHILAYNNGYTIGVKVNEVQYLQTAINQSTLQFKGIRKLPIQDDQNFAIEKSDKLTTILLNATTTITFAAIAIGLITLLGAAIGLMNIMLVTVNERTKEVGLVKAIGATNKNIQYQFLYESIIIAIMGAIVGVVLGLLIGNLVGNFLNVPFFIPWRWIIGGIILCTFSGLLAGIYPAHKAAKLNPIQALRYE